MSCRAVSSEEFAKTMPVSPPMVKRKIKPRAHSIGGFSFDSSPVQCSKSAKYFNASWNSNNYSS